MKLIFIKLARLTGNIIILISVMAVIVAGYVQFSNRINLNQRLVKMTVSNLVPNVSWTDLQISLNSHGLWYKTFMLSSSGFCYKSRTLEYCHKTGSLSVQLKWYFFFPVVEKIGPVAINQARLVFLGADQKQDASGSSDGFDRLVSYYNLVSDIPSFGAVDIDFQQILLPDGFGAQSLSGKVSWQGYRKPRFGDLNIDFFQTDTVSSSHQPMSFSLSYHSGKENGLEKGTLSVVTNFAGHRMRAKVDDLVANSDSYKALIEYRRLSHHIDVKAMIAPQSREGMDISYDFRYQMNRTPHTSLEFKDCHLALNAKREFQTNFDELIGNTSCQGLTKIFAPHYAKSDIKKIFPHLITKFDIGFLFREGQLSYDVQLSSKNVDSANKAILKTDISFALHSSISLDDPRLELKQLRPSLKAVINFTEFGQLSRLLDQTPWSLPAPLNQLDGEFSCETYQLPVIADQNLQLPLQCRSSLASDRQRLNLKIDLMTSIGRSGSDIKYQINADIILLDVLFVLPDFSLAEKFPVFIVDKRIMKDPLPEENSMEGRRVQSLPSSLSNFEYSIRVRTEKNRFLRLQHQLLHTPLPVQLDVTFASGQKKDGYILVEKYPLKLFQHLGILEKFLVTLQTGSETKLEALAKIEQADHTINLLVGGSLNRVFWHVESEPPMNETQLLSRLVFGKEVDRLSGENARSLQSMRAAVADGAINILSMYYLASTPIESIGYDAVTGQVSAAFVLKQGIIVQLGAGGSSAKEFTLKKRLGKNWSFETGAVFDQERFGRKGTATIRWGKRY